MKLNPKIIRIGLISLGIAVIATGAYLQFAQQQPPPEPPLIRPVKTVVVKSVDEAEVIQQTGEIQPRTETLLSFLIGGKVITRSVEVGDIVEAGAVLATLDDTDVSNELKAAEAELAGAVSSENQAKLANKRASDLVKTSGISRAEAEVAAAAYDAAVAKREAAQSLVDAARRKKSYTLLTARESGIATTVSANVGEVVAPGQAIVSIASLNEREAVFAVPETLINLGSPDLPVEVSLISNPELKTVGKIREVSPYADKGTRTFQVRVSLPNAPEEMALGVSVRGRAILPSRLTFQIPPASLTSVGDEPAVYVVQTETGTLDRRSIKVGRFGSDFISVTEGIREGELVVTAGVSKLRPQQIVKLEGEGTR